MSAPARTRTLVCVAILLAGCSRAFALNPQLEVAQYAHTSWTNHEAFFKGAIYSITQSADGFIWLATEFGLLRFDGVRTVPWQPPSDWHLPSTKVTALLAARDGALFIGTEKGLASWKDGKLTLYPDLSGLLVLSLREDHEGTIWSGGFAYAPPGKLCAIRKNRVRCYREDGSLGNGVLGLYEDSKARLWAGVMNGSGDGNLAHRNSIHLAATRTSFRSRTASRTSQEDDGTLLIPLEGRGSIR